MLYLIDNNKVSFKKTNLVFYYFDTELAKIKYFLIKFGEILLFIENIVFFSKSKKQ